MPRKASAPPLRKGRSRAVSFRLDHELFDRLNTSAARVGTNRNRLVALVLRKYIIERGDLEIDNIVGEAAADERQINLFG